MTCSSIFSNINRLKSIQFFIVRWVIRRDIIVCIIAFYDVLNCCLRSDGVQLFPPAYVFTTRWPNSYDRMRGMDDERKLVIYVLQ